MLDQLYFYYFDRRPVDIDKEPLEDYWALISHSSLQNGAHFRVLVQGISYIFLYLVGNCPGCIALREGKNSLINQCIYFVLGDAGIGKTTVVHIIAMEWADCKNDILKQYDFVFVIPLRDVKGNETLEELILANHHGLGGNSCPPEWITALLSEDHHKVLVIFDGYDEYTPGTNKYIDKAITRSTLWNSCMMMTSRSCDKLLPVRDFMDAEAQILGFSDESIKIFVEKYLGKEKLREFMAQAKKRGVTDLLNIPILLQMLCELYASRKKLPSNISGILQAIVELCFERERKRLNKTWKFADIKHYLIKLGRLAWMALNKKTQQLLLDKVRF